MNIKIKVKKLEFAKQQMELAKLKLEIDKSQTRSKTPKMFSQFKN